MDLCKFGGITIGHTDRLNVASEGGKKSWFGTQATGCILWLFTEMGIQGGAGLLEKVGMRLRF